MRFEFHHSIWIAASAITVTCFVTATAYTQKRLAQLDALSSAIETNSVPSVDYLSHAAVRLTHINQLLDAAAKPGGERAAALGAVREEVAALEGDIDRYLRLTPLPGERELWGALRADVARSVQLIRAAIDGEPDTPTAVRVPSTDQVDDAIDRAVRSVLVALQFDVRQSEAMARDVRNVRVRTLRTIIELDAVATLIAAFAVVVAYRATLRHERLQRAHTALLAARVTELDTFAGRVAHDVLSPLGTIAAALSLLGESADARRRTYIDRSQRALQRVQQLVEDLLMFARSGAQPDPAARCSVNDVLASVAADSTDAAAQQGIELVVDAGEPLTVPCSAGVMTSIVQNLARNAIKYMGTRPLRRVTLRARAVAPVCRVEVEDTGPGIPDCLQRTIFEPFVRGRHEQVSGTGLGLSTVKRLVESHGGAVGVTSTAGAGALFWVELPLASTGSAEAPPSAAAHHV